MARKPAPKKPTKSKAPAKKPAAKAKAKPRVVRKRGRPSSFTKALGDKICARLCQGESLRTICKSEDMPALSSVFKWAVEIPEFSEQYARAREFGVESRVDEIMDIADDGSNDFMERELEGGHTTTVADHEHINRSRIRIEARKWEAAKIIPKKYGDKLQVDHKHSFETMPVEELADRIKELGKLLGIPVPKDFGKTS